VASLSQGRTAAAQCGLFTHKSVPVIFEPPCNSFGAVKSVSIRPFHVKFKVDMINVHAMTGGKFINYIETFNTFWEKLNNSGLLRGKHPVGYYL